MTNPVSPPSAPSVPVYPELGSPNFNQQAYAFATAMPAVSQRLGELSQTVHTNALSAIESAVVAAASAVGANQAQAVALAAANFKGNYADLTGPINKPATVKHAGRFWLLMRNLADVAADVPGVSDAWTSLDSGQVITQKITTDTQGIAGVKYLIAGPGITLTAPAVWNKGDRFGYQLVVPVNGQKINFGAVPVMGNVLGLVDIDVPRVNDNWQYEDNTLGLIAQ